MERINSTLSLQVSFIKLKNGHSTKKREERLRAIPERRGNTTTAFNCTKYYIYKGLTFSASD
jgi:hypothetical protein